MSMLFSYVSNLLLAGLLLLSKAYARRYHQMGGKSLVCSALPLLSRSKHNSYASIAMSV